MSSSGSAVPGTVTVQVCCPGDTLATFYVFQPRADKLRPAPPLCHPSSDDETWQTLQAALAHAEQNRWAPVFFVVPELTLDTATLLDAILERCRSLHPDHVVVAGLGHMNEAQCARVEPDNPASPRCATPWPADRYANSALVAIGGSPPAFHLEGKCWDSHNERTHAVHHAFREVRVFQGDDIRFAVLICSEMEAPTGDSFPARLAAAHVDVVFWLQHNEKPRSSVFLDNLRLFYPLRRDVPIFVVANKRPGSDRGKFGASGIIGRADACFHPSKARFPTSPFIATESVHVPRPALARAAFLRYDVPVFMMRTVLSGRLPERDGSDRTFLEEVQPFHYRRPSDDGTVGVLEPCNERTHLRELFSIGSEKARARATQAGLPAVMLDQLGGGVGRSQNSICATMHDLLNFLDRAVVQDVPRDESRGIHENHEDHPRSAAACGCWLHRRDFDRLFADADTWHPWYLAELALAAAVIAARSHATVRVLCEDREPANLAVDIPEQGERRILLAIADCVAESFDDHYRRRQRGPAIGGPPRVVLESFRSMAGRDAADALASHGADGSRVVFEPEGLFGAEFWSMGAERFTAWLRGGTP